MLWTFFAILLILGLLGFHIAGASIHLLLVAPCWCSSSTSLEVHRTVADRVHRDNSDLHMLKRSVESTDNLQQL